MYGLPIQGMSCSFREKILQFDRPVPRYTSYPTAPHFQPVKSRDMYRSWLQTLPDGEHISLYLHVPFCPKLCWYCGCNTKITQRYEPVESYVGLMIREIELLSAAVRADHKVTHIHFGGGSPGMLHPHDFGKIMEKLRAGFTIDPSAEIAIEIDPRGITEGRVAAYAKHGVNRISLGAQDFDETVLKSVNRQQPFHLSYNAVQLLNSYGINAINLDLLYGLPHQTPETISATINKALTLNPDRIAFFGYAHVPWMKKHMRLINEAALPGSELRYDLFEIGVQMLADAGYEAVGIDHFAKPEDALVRAANEGRLKRNFQGYTSDKAGTLLGLGVSSIGQLSQGYIQNAVAMPQYRNDVLEGQLPVQKYCPLSEEDVLRSAVIEQLMCNFEADIPALCEQHAFARDHLDQDIKKLHLYEGLGFVEVTSVGQVIINRAARPMARIISSVFDAYMADAPETPRHAPAV